MNKVHSDLSKAEIRKKLKSHDSTKGTRTSKKAELRKELESEKRRRDYILGFTGIFIILVAIVGGYYISTLQGDSGGNDDYTPQPTKETKDTSNKNEIRIPLSEVSDGKAQFYSYDSNGIKIRYFVLKSSDGIIRAAFDTCDVCYKEKKGYHQEGDEMVCNNCNQRFPSVKINEEKGGCNPAPLDRTVDGNDLVIKTNDLENGRWYFE